MSNLNFQITELSIDDPIASGSTVKTNWYNAELLPYINIYAATDQDCTIFVQLSDSVTDNDSLIDSKLPIYYRATSGFINPPHSYKCTRKYIRIVVQNTSSSDQTYIRVGAMASSSALLNIPTDAKIARGYDSLSVRPTDFSEEVALGRRQGITLWNKFFYNDSISGTEIVAAFGGTFQFLTTGETITIKSSDVNDTLLGSGLQKIVVYGIDENWDEQIEVFDMDGTSDVISTSLWIGINRVATFKANPSTKKNAGTITITATTSGYTMATMPAGEGVTQQAILYVPRKTTALASSLYFNGAKLSGGASPKLDINGYVYSDVNTAIQEIYRDKLDTSIEQHIDLSPDEKFPIGEKSILWFEATSDTPTAGVRGRFSAKFYDDVDK